MDFVGKLVDALDRPDDITIATDLFLVKFVGKLLDHRHAEAPALRDFFPCLRFKN